MVIIERRCTLLLLSIIITIIIQNISAQHYSNNEVNPGRRTQSQTNDLRYRRAIVKKPGFFWTFGSSIFQQYNETKSAIQQIRNLLDDQFISERQMAAAKTSTTTVAPTGSTEATTQAPYRITRQEFNRILMRNLKGLVRLYNLELDTALKQSNLNRAEFNKQLRTSLKQQLS